MPQPRDSKWVCGKHVVRACFENPCREVYELAVQDGACDICDIARKRSVPVEFVQENWFDKKFPDQVHQKIAASVSDLNLIDLIDVVNEGKNVVILDLITDPHNIGAIIRSAAVFGIGAVIIQDKGSPQRDNCVVNKASSGAVEIVPLIRETNLTRAIEQLKKNGYWCISLTEHGDQSLDQIDMNGKIALIVGSEGNGIRRLILEKSDFKANIPNTNKGFSTLNAAQAATIAMYELLKHNKG